MSTVLVSTLRVLHLQRPGAIAQWRHVQLLFLNHGLSTKCTSCPGHIVQLSEGGSLKEQSRQVLARESADLHKDSVRNKGQSTATRPAALWQDQQLFVSAGPVDQQLVVLVMHGGPKLNNL